MTETNTDLRTPTAEPVVSTPEFLRAVMDATAAGNAAAIKELI